jgi:hypothetical protein
MQQIIAVPIYSIQYKDKLTFVNIMSYLRTSEIHQQSKRIVLFSVFLMQL